jgi:hypothetical protein
MIDLLSKPNVEYKFYDASKCGTGRFAVRPHGGLLRTRHRVSEKAGLEGRREFEPSILLNFFMPVIRSCETETDGRGSRVSSQPGFTATRLVNNLSLGSGFIWMKESAAQWRDEVSKRIRKCSGKK